MWPVREGIRGYVQGYNRYLAETGVNNISDPACRGAARVRPITELDVSRHAHAEIIMGVADPLLHVGNGHGSVTDLEFWLEGESKHVKDRMDALGMSYYYVDYGDGSAWGTQCNGGHNGGCWEQDLRDLIPRLERAFAS